MNQDFRDLLSRLNKEKAKYLVIGGYAVTQHAEPRYTKDLDIWIGADPRNGKRVFKALAEFGAPVAGYPIDDFLKSGQFLVIGVAPNRIDVICDIAGVDFEECYSRRVKVNLGDLTATFISMEDLIRNKEAAGRHQDLADVEKLRAALAVKKGKKK
ncbi:MAG: DUF6036 family nucleotidyltransferase [Blastocatellia bacterium]